MNDEIRLKGKFDMTEPDFTELISENLLKSTSPQYEVYYNNYGPQGYVDIVVRDDDIDEVVLFELKSKYAVEQTTGANEILRQVKNMQMHFFQDDRHDRPESGDIYNYLLVTPCRHNLKHIDNYKRMYASIAQNIYIGTYDPFTHLPVPILTPDFDYRKAGYPSYRKTHAELVKLLERTFREITDWM